MVIVPQFGEVAYVEHESGETKALVRFKESAGAKAAADGAAKDSPDVRKASALSAPCCPFSSFELL